MSLLYIQISFLFLIGRHSLVNSAECRELFEGNVKKKILDSDDITISRPRKLQNSKNGVQQFRKLIARFFLLEIFLYIYHCFQCIIKQLLDMAYA